MKIEGERKRRKKIRGEMNVSNGEAMGRKSCGVDDMVSISHVSSARETCAGYCMESTRAVKFSHRRVNYSHRVVSLISCQKS